MKIFRCSPLNWEIEKKYVSLKEREDNPEIYVIHIGSLDDMWSVVFNPKTMIYSFTSVHYSKDEVYKFKVDSIEEASQLAEKFAIGMGRLDDIEGTIYTEGNIDDISDSIYTK